MKRSSKTKVIQMSQKQKRRETWVKGHYTHARNGEVVYVAPHRMRENEKVHKRHLRRLREEIEGLKELEER